MSIKNIIGQVVVLAAWPFFLFSKKIDFPAYVNLKSMHKSYI